MTTTLRIRKGDDFHVHLRQGKILHDVVLHTTKQFKRATIMPNTSPPILTAGDALAYQREIFFLNADANFTPLMTIQINEKTTPEIIREAKEAGVVAGKVYPQGVTTNSQNGVADFRLIYPALEKMQEVEILLLLHGEDPWEKACCLDREKMFLTTLFQIHRNFPRLKIVLEHITTADAVEFITNLPSNVSATITAHHLCMTIDDIVGGLLQPHNFCKPIAKYPHDLLALLQAATSGNPKFFFGSDSAPHLREKKECACGCAGCFTAPIAMQLLCQIFEKQDKLEMLENFVSRFGADFYGLPRNTEIIELVKRDWIVPEEYYGIVPFMANQTLSWQLAE